MFDKKSDIICVTDRKLCRGDFLEQVERIAEGRPAAIILREKDLSELEYEKLAARVMEICRRADVSCVLHSFAATAARLSAGCWPFVLSAAAPRSGGAGGTL